jgi:superfamily II DNA or RNA helicase
MKMTDRETILRKISTVERQIFHLRNQQEEAESTLRSLKEDFALIDSRTANRPGYRAESSICNTENLTSEEKITIFLRLFQGRKDVYPKLWQNQKTGKKGYSPACSNEWIHGVCNKPRIKCGECTNQAFLPVTPEAILDHLQGRQVIGVYPMLKDETCRLLAADFDKGAWREDVMAFTDSCRVVGIPYAIERSHSGNGAHVWFFFSHSVTASTARKLGSYLITQTMSRRHQLDMSSYDRLFPNQDTLPKGGFGNLIALPLQYHPRQEGNTLFLDDQLEPFSDQWRFLASLNPIQPEKINEIIRNISTPEQVMGLHGTYVDDVDVEPWLKSACRDQNHISINDPIPDEVRAVMSQRLFVEKSGLPASLINRLQRLAAFQNPEFYKKQNLRLSTALTPRVISCAEDHSDHISLPRGCLEAAQTLLRENNSSLELEDLRNPGDIVEVNFSGELTEVQKQAVNAMCTHENGVIVAPPGFGKTVLGTYLISARKCSTLILVHRQLLLDQWRSQLSIFLDRDTKSIGQLGGGKRKLTGQIDVAMIQSLTRKGVVNDVVAKYGQVIIDECHHLPAVSFERVLSEVKARYIVGLTATPQRRDGHHPIIYMQIGPIRFKADTRVQSTQRPFEHRIFVRETGFELPMQASDITIQALYSLLVNDEERNQQIIDDVLQALEEGRSPILLTERKVHLDYLHQRLKEFVRHIVVLKGGRSLKDQQKVYEELASIPKDEERLLLATGRYIGEGFDDARLDTLLLSLPVSWKGTLVQYAGRLHRTHPGKHEVRIVDYADSKVPVLARMFERRLRGYRAMGYRKKDDVG